MCLIIWDKMFGTFQDEVDEDPIVYGLTKPLQKPGNPINHVTHEFKGMISDMKKKIPLSTKLKYLFKAPGWSHDGSTKTADQLRKELLTVSDASQASDTSLS